MTDADSALGDEALPRTDDDPCAAALQRLWGYLDKELTAEDEDELRELLHDYARERGLVPAGPGEGLPWRTPTARWATRPCGLLLPIASSFPRDVPGSSPNGL